MLQKLRKKPLLASMLVGLIYLLAFLLVSYLNTPVKGEPHAMGIKEAIGVWREELLYMIWLTIAITALGWWQKIGFRSVNAGGSKFLLAPLLLIALMLFGAWTDNKSPHIYFGFDSLAPLLPLFLAMLMVGFTEESMFRGVLFHGLATKFQPLAVVALVAVMFGTFHFINLLFGQPMGATLYQVIAAVGAGFLYAALRLRLGSIWPIILLHGLWDTTVFILQTVKTANHSDTLATATTFSLESAIMIALPQFLYGLFVYWRWTKWSGKDVLTKGNL